MRVCVRAYVRVCACVCVCVLQAIIDQECVMHRKNYNTQRESREFPLSDYSEEEETEE